MRLSELPNQRVGWGPVLELLLKLASVYAATQGDFHGHAGLGMGASGRTSGKCQLCLCHRVVNTRNMLTQLPPVRMPVFVVMSLLEAVVAEVLWGS